MKNCQHAHRMWGRWYLLHARLFTRQVVYVAQENLVLDMPAKAPQHPLINKLFTGFDTTLGVFLLSTTLQTIFSPSTVNEDYFFNTTTF